MAQVSPYLEDNAVYVELIDTPLRPRLRQRPNVPGLQRMLLILASIAVIVSLLLAIKPAPHVASAGVAQPQGATVAEERVSPAFTPQVHYWSGNIRIWADAHGLDPDIVATIMQIESCGYPEAVSSAGAQGLFQVMPFHFSPGEDSLDPDTNARRGLAYFVERLAQTGRDTGRAFAGYNGGQRAAATGWDNWLPETQRYYVWATGIYDEVQSGLAESPTLQRWLEAGGAGLCRQAAQWQARPH